jgi:hypothetical protein
MEMILHSINYLLYYSYLNTVNLLSSIQASGILTNWQNLKKKKNYNFYSVTSKTVLQCTYAHIPRGCLPSHQEQCYLSSFLTQVTLQSQ